MLCAEKLKLEAFDENNAPKLLDDGGEMMS
jgi:hypothetical protein